MADSISTTFARQDKGKEPHHENLPSCVQVALWRMVLQPWSLQMSPGLFDGFKNENLYHC